MKTSALAPPWLRLVLDQNERLRPAVDWPLMQAALKCFLRYDAGHYTTSGGLITDVADQSPAGFGATQAAGALQPTLATVNGVTCATYAGGQVLGIAAGLAAFMTGDHTIWTVQKSTDNTGSRCIARTGTAGGIALDVESSTIAVRRLGGSTNTDGAPTLLWELWCFTSISGVLSLWVNGVDTGIPSAGSIVAPSGVSYWGALAAALTFPFKGYGAEFGALAAGLDAAGQGGLYTYAGGRYPLGT